MRLAFRPVVRGPEPRARGLCGSIEFRLRQGECIPRGYEEERGKGNSHPEMPLAPGPAKEGGNTSCHERDDVKERRPTRAQC